MKLLNKNSTKIEAELLDAGIVLGKYPFIKELFYDLNSLVITYDPDSSGKLIKITFNEVVGFRCLDEGDLLDFWESQFITDNWFFEIKKGGWLEQESQREGFISKHSSPSEFFICGTDDCVNVISLTPPAFDIEDSF